MQRRYYIDTAIWRDYYENRSDNLRPLGEWALACITKIIIQEGTILYSDFIKEELKISYSDEEQLRIFEIGSKSECLKRIEISNSEIEEARKISQRRDIPFGDALHAILARNNNATLITRDHHFEKLQDIVKIRKPEELL